MSDDIVDRAARHSDRDARSQRRRAAGVVVVPEARSGRPDRHVLVGLDSLVATTESVDVEGETWIAAEPHAYRDLPEVQ